VPRFHTHAKGGHRSHPLQKCIPVLCSLFALPSITRCLPSSLPFRAQFYTVTCGGPSGPPAHLHSGVWRVVCFWPQRSPSPLLSANLLARQAPPVRRWARARHRSSESPSPRQQAHLLLLPFIPQDFLCRRRLCAGAWRSQPATPRSFPGTRVPPSGALTVLHELFSSLGAVSEPGIWLWFSMQGLLRWLSPTCVNLQLDNGFPGTVFEVPLGSLTPCLIVSGFLILLQCRFRRSPASSCLVSSLALSA
jgi:hypothetical protein